MYLVKNGLTFSVQIIPISTKVIMLQLSTLESGIDVGQEITIGPGKFFKKNKHRALNKRRA